MQGSELKALRLRLGLSQKTMGERLGKGKLVRKKVIA